MKRQVVAILLYIAAIFVGGCAVQGAVQGRPFEKIYLPPGNAVIYVYRPYSYAGSLLRPSVRCGEDTARIGPGGYQAFIVPAGQVVCSVQTETAHEVEIEAQPDVVYYIREQIGWGVLTGHPRLNPMDTDQAQTEIQTCCVLEP
jgi:hypothetical protein